jgi:hypothetical protein
MVRRTLLGLFWLPLGGCATVGGIRTAPLDAGTAHFFRQPLPVVAAAARSAVDSVHLTFDTAFAPDSQSAMLVAHHGMDVMLSYGEIVRILARAQADSGTLVNVYTRARLATNVTHADFNDAVFRELARALARSAAASSAALPAPGLNDAPRGWAPQGAALVSLGAGRRILVKSGDGVRVQGVVLDANDSMLTIQTSGPLTRRIPTPAIDSLWSSRGHARTGMVVGMLAGVAAVIVTGPYHCSTFDTVTCVANAEQRAVGFIVGGLLVGAIVGSRVRSWQIRYP